jgi:hypothetical protein
VRGAYGIFYIFLDTNIPGNVAQTPPYQANQTMVNTRPLPTSTFADPFLGQPIVPGNPNPGAPCAFGFAALSCATPTLSTTTTQLKQSYMQEWNFSVQTQLTHNLSLDVAYVGNTTIRSAQSVSENDPPPGPGSSVQARRPLPQWGPISLKELRGSGNYNSLQVKVEKRFSQGFQMLAAYTNSKCIDHGSDQGGPPTSLFYVVNRATCDFNISQNLVVSSVYELPFGAGRRFLNSGRFVNHVLGGWEVAGILTLRTGLPFTPTISSDRANTGVGSQRPNRLGQGSSSDPTPTLWFNPNDFAVPAQFTYGNSGRNILNADPLRQLDLTVLKRFRITERKGLEFRTEFFNLPNHAVFAIPVTTIDLATAGRVTSTLNSSRVLQFALKFSF